MLVLNELRALGIDPIVLLTGDRAAAAKAITQDLSFTEIRAELSPEQKAQIVAGLKVLTPASPGGRRIKAAPLPPEGENGGVAMVGDGINDAPALAHADVGIAIAGAADIAAEAGDIVLMGDPLKPLPLLVGLSRETVKIIRQNIIWFAFVVNAVGIVVTAWLWPLFTPESWYEQSPLAAVIYHQIGSLLVLLNSMRLLWFERGLSSQAWTDRLTRFDYRLERLVDFDGLTHWCEHHWKRLALIVVAVALTWYGLQRADDHRAGRGRRGAPLRQARRRFGAGLASAAFHGPIEDTLRVSQQLRSVSIGFRETLQTDKQTGAMTWSSAHRKETRIGEEALMITGDGNLVDVLVSVRFKVDDQPHVYLFQVNNVEEILLAAAESELRAMVAGRPFLDLLTVQRGQFQDQALERIKARCKDLGYDDLGIDIDSIAIVDLHPPAEVVDSYYQVAKAMQNRDQAINLAQASKIRKLKEAEAEAQKSSPRPAATRPRRSSKQGDYQQLSRPVSAAQNLRLEAELGLAMDAAAELFGGHTVDEVGVRYHQKRGALLAMQPALTDFRIYWDAVAKALSGRDLLLIDSDKVTGAST